MDTLGLGRIGISLDVSPSYLDDARELEALVFTALWVAGGQIDRLGRLTGLVHATETAIIESDPDRARAAARKPLSFLATVLGYRQNFLRVGFTETDVDDLSDRFVDALAAWGSIADIEGRVAAQHEAGADHVVLAPLGGSAIDAGRALSELVATSK